MGRIIQGTVINADDFGYSESVNRAIVYCLDNGLITQTTVMVNMPGYNDAKQMSKEKKLIGKVGLHLNLSEGIPLTDLIKKQSLFCDSEGKFNGAFRRSKRCYLWLKPSERRAISLEIEAQMHRYIDAGFTMMHIDSHHHVHTIPALQMLVIRLAKEHNFKSMRISRNVYTGKGRYKLLLKFYENRRILKYFDTTRKFVSASIFERLSIEENSIELMVHPDYIEDRLVDILNRRILSFREFNGVKI